MIVCSLMTISVVSGRGRLTLEAMAAGSVSTIILDNGSVSSSNQDSTGR
jgi:shikimate 5-dehydrogenase